ncbi:MAG: response regulator [Myxococcota bacterium]|nr:response regulator [Myxococcota bacterium]
MAPTPEESVSGASQKPPPALESGEVFSEPDLVTPDNLLPSSIRLALFGSVALMIGTPFLINGTVGSSIGMYLPLSLLFAALLKLHSKGYRGLTGWGFCVVLFSAVCLGVLFFGGIKEQTAIAFSTVIVMAALNLGAGAALLFSVLSAVAVVCLVKADQFGLTPTPLILISQEGMLSSTLLNLGIVAVVMRRAITQLKTAEQSLGEARRNQEVYATSLQKLHAQTRERAKSSRKITEVAEAVIHAEFDAWRPGALQSIREMFDAAAVGLYQDPSGSGAHLAEWVGGQEWANESTWNIFKAYDSTVSSSPFRVLRKEENAEVFAELPEGIVDVLLITVPGRIRNQGALALMLEQKLDISPGLAKDIQTLRSIVGSSLERSLAEQKMRVAQRMETVGRLAGSVAHDFNNLLTTIMGCSQLLLDEGKESGEDAELLLDISRAADHAALLTRQLLALSRKQIVLVGPVDLNEATQAFCRMADRMAGEKIEVTFDSLDSPGYVLADPSNIEQILLNLTVNARDAMPDGGKIAIDLRRVPLPDSLVGDHTGDECLRLEFSDSGCGMSPHVLTHLFEPFFTTKTTGTGLGLASVREVIADLGGGITVRSDPEAGTTFSIFIREEKLEDIASRNSKESQYYGGNGERVLLVDDHDQVRKTLARVLKEAGFQVLVAHDGLEAIRILNEPHEPIDLILTDVVMPAISGIDFANRIRESGVSTPILFMSGFADSGQREIGLIGDFIAKPFTSSRLLTRIGLILSKNARPSIFANAPPTDRSRAGSTSRFGS